MDFKKTIFVDCFDTIILRNVPANKVKYIWAEEMNRKYNCISCEKFYNAFLSSEEKIRHENYYKYGVGESELSDISKLIIKRFKMYKIFKEDIENESFVQASIKAYIDAEKNVIYKNQKVINKLIKFKNNGSKIFVVSDFYCGKDLLMEMFKHLKIENLFDKVYVSCDYYKTKENGNLYTHILKENNLNVKEVLMIGDNINSDNIVPNKLGIASIKLTSKNNKFRIKERLNKIKTPKNFKDIFKTNHTNNLSNCCFALFVFTKRLVEKIQENNVKNIFFLSREGEFLKKIFDFYLKEFNIENINSHYLQVSRNSILVAGLNKLENENFDTVLRETKAISVKKFLITIGFSNQDIEKIASNLKIDIECEIGNFLTSSDFNELKQNEDFIKIYNSSRAKQKEAFEMYLESFNVNMKDGLHIVDVGWKGTMQDLLVKFFNNKIDVTGYYLGYNGYGKESENNIKYGLLHSSAPFKEDLIERIYKTDILNFEQFLRASTNRVSGYTKKDDKIVIEYDNKINDVEFYKNYIEKFQLEIYEKFTKICRLYKEDCKLDIENICLMLYIKMLKSFSYKDYRFISLCNNSHYDSFARIGFASHGKISKKQYIKYVLRKLKLKLKFLLNKI